MRIMTIKTSLSLLSGLLLLVSCSSGPFASQAPGPGAVVKSFVAVAIQGDIAQMKKYVSKKDVARMEAQEKNNPFSGLGKGMAESMRAQAERELKSKGGVKSIDIDKEQITGDTATVTCIVRFGNGESKSNQVKCVKEEGNWKVQR